MHFYCATSEDKKQVPPAGAGAWGPPAPRGNSEAWAWQEAHNCTRSVVFVLRGSGTLVQLKAAGFSSFKRYTYGKRGEIKAWSKASRRRLLYRVSSVCWQSVPREELFHVGLTYPAEVFPSGEKAKRDLRVFRARLDRLFGRGGYGLWWKLEFQKRGWPEFNCVLRVLRIPKAWAETFKGLEVGSAAFLALLREWISRTWFEVVGSGEEKHLRAGTEVSRPYGESRKLAAYMVKYLAKTGKADKEYQHEVPEGYNPGRWWGIFNSSAFPIVWESVRLPSASVYVNARRILCRYVRATSRIRGKKFRLRVTSFLSGVVVLAGLDDMVVFRRLSEFLLRGSPPKSSVEGSRDGVAPWYLGRDRTRKWKEGGFPS